jgi:catalase
MVHAFKGEPDSNIPSSSSSHNNFWDFISLTPESTHMIIWLFSDRGTPKSYRMMEGFGVNTYVWVNSEGKRQYVKYHWKPKLGVQSLDRHEATRLAGVDPDCLSRDLWDTIARGEDVEYELFVQLMNIEDELKQDFDPLDPTKTWPEDKFPLMPVGKMVLNHNPKNFFAEVEQAAFCPASIVPGVEFSADKLLQGRTFSYADTQRHRLGPNYLQIPVNRPLVEVNNSQRDGSMQMGEYSGPVNYEPARIAEGSLVEAPSGTPSTFRVEGEVAKRKISKTNDFQQAGEKYRSLSKIDKEHLVDNLVADLTPIDRQIQLREIANLTKADPELGKLVTKGLKL